MVGNVKMCLEKLFETSFNRRDIHTKMLDVKSMSDLAIRGLILKRYYCECGVSTVMGRNGVGGW